MLKHVTIPSFTNSSIADASDKTQLLCMDAQVIHSSGRRAFHALLNHILLKTSFGDNDRCIASSFIMRTSPVNESKKADHVKRIIPPYINGAVGDFLGSFYAGIGIW